VNSRSHSESDLYVTGNPEMMYRWDEAESLSKGILKNPYLKQDSNLWICSFGPTGLSHSLLLN
jgi:hypothetical protein